MQLEGDSKRSKVVEHVRIGSVNVGTKSGRNLEIYEMSLMMIGYAP